VVKICVTFGLNTEITSTGSSAMIETARRWRKCVESAVLSDGSL